MAARRKLAGIVFALLAVLGHAYLAPSSIVQAKAPSGYARLARAIAEQRQLERKGNRPRARMQRGFQARAESSYSQPELAVHAPRGPPALL